MVGLVTGRSVRGTEAIQRLIEPFRPQCIVIDICSGAGWVGDLVTALGFELQVATTSAPAWRRNNTKRKTDRDDDLRLAQLSSLN